MTQDEYRIKHSLIIEESIHLEDLLKRYYGLVSGNGEFETFYKSITDLDGDTMGKLIHEYIISDFDFELPDDFIEKLNNAKEIRNYYAHKVFYNHTPFSNNKVKLGDEKKINESLYFLSELNDLFRKIYDSKVKELKELGKL